MWGWGDKIQDWRCVGGMASFHLGHLLSFEASQEIKELA